MFIPGSWGLYTHFERFYFIWKGFCAVAEELVFQLQVKCWNTWTFVYRWKYWSYALWGEWVSHTTYLTSCNDDAIGHVSVSSLTWPSSCKKETDFVHRRKGWWYIFVGHWSTLEQSWHDKEPLQICTSFQSRLIWLPIWRFICVNCTLYKVLQECE